MHTTTLYVHKQLIMVYVKIVLDTRRKNEEGVYPIKLRVTHQRVQRYYLTGYKMSSAEFPELLKDAPPKRLKEIKIQVGAIELKAKNIINKMEAFSFLAFEEKLYANEKASKSIFELYKEIIDDKMQQGKVGTAINYQCSMKSLQSFSPRLSFIDITPKLLKTYEKQLLAEGKSVSTVGIYMRPLRAVLNEAINRKFMSRELYPFGMKKFIIPESKNIKKALSREDFKKLVDYTSSDKGSFEARSRDFWLLSYLLQGANMKDILLLKHENIEKEYIHFVREKTKDTVRRNITEITVPILPETMEIINCWKDSSRNSGYVFNFINDSMTPMDIYKAVQNFVKVTNDNMSLIAQKVGLNKRITTYAARYTFTKAMLDADVSVEFIRQCLGHQNYSTTKRYIQSFELEKKLDIAKRHLLKFD